MSESESALPPLDHTFWEHVDHLDFAIAIPVSKDRLLDVVGALHDIYDTLVEGDLEDAKMCTTALAAILVASKYGKANEVWEEFSVKEAMVNFDDHMKEILNEER
jgi:tryptophan 2,3-dioxygenase